MADNSLRTPGTGESIRTVDKTSNKTQVVILDMGGSGTEDIAAFPGTGAGNLGKAEDAIHASGDVGVMSLAVRKDTAVGLSADGDYHVLEVDANGRLHVLDQNSASIAASLSVIDDWDEADRAKVNPIVGQAGVAGGSGVVGNTTQRVVLATDVALPTGSNAIGKLAANSGVDIGDVDITSVVPGTGATNLGKAEDAIHNSGDVGVMALAIRSDTLAAKAADGDYVPIQTNSSGSVYTTVLDIFPGSAATNLGKAEDAAHSSADVGVMALTVRKNTAAATSDADGDYQPLISDTNGRLHTLDANSASILTSVQLIDDTVFADDAAFTVATSKVNAVGFMADETATDSVDEGDVGIPRMTLDRQIRVVEGVATAGGCSFYKTIDLDETEEEVKSSAGQIYGWFVSNRATAERFVKFYNNTAAGTVVGTTVPDWTINLQPGQAANVTFPMGIAMSTGITIAATTGIGDADATAPGANDVVAIVWYK